MTRIGNLSYNKKIMIGRGTFSDVFRGQYNAPDTISRSGVPSELAVKRIVLSSDVIEESFLQEVNLMKLANAKDHPNILRYICTEKNDDFL